MTRPFVQDIPIEKKRFINILDDSLDEKQREQFENFARVLEHCCHYHIHDWLNQLCTSYKPFNDNANSEFQLDEDKEHEHAKDLIAKFKQFLEYSNYKSISEYDILDILARSEKKNFHVHFPFEKYQEFLVYFQEEEVIVNHYRRWYTLWLKKHTHRIPYYKKLVVVSRRFKAILKKSQEIVVGMSKMNMPITIKLFQNIPHYYLPIIFPDIVLKTRWSSKIYWACIVLVATAIAMSGLLFFQSWWYSLMGVLPLWLVLYEFIVHHQSKRQYYQHLLSHSYYNNLYTNEGVLQHLIEQAEERLYKQLLIGFHVFWQHNSLGYYNLNIDLLNSSLPCFFLKYCGIQRALKLENTLMECGRFCENSELRLFPSITAQSAVSSHVMGDVKKGTYFLDLEKNGDSLSRAGMIEVDPGTPEAEQKAFVREEFLLHLQPPERFKFSHQAGTAIRWVIEKPYQIKLLEECQIGSNFLVVSLDGGQQIPLQGIGRIKNANNSFEFRYYRNPNSNRLTLTAGLRYRHTAAPNAPVLVRPVLPSFVLIDTLPEGTREIPLPGKITFPQRGFVRLAMGTPKDFFTTYTITNIVRGSVLSLRDKTPTLYEVGTKVALIHPMTEMNAFVPRGSWLVPVKETKDFNKWGVAILSPSTEFEERCSFYREALTLELDTPLNFSYRKGNIVQFAHDVKSKLISKAKKGSKFIIVQGVDTCIEEGFLAISTVQNRQENIHFVLRKKSLCLVTPTKNQHVEKSEVWEAIFETPLRYEVFQGNYLIPVEDASNFPLIGTVEIHFTRNTGVKEVFPFQRDQGSNTLSLTTRTENSFDRDSTVLITSVDVTSQSDIPYGTKSIYADFSCVPDFPETGELIIDPGTQIEENVKFNRYPRRMYLKEPILNNHSQNIAVDFSKYAHLSIKEPLKKNTDRIQLEYSHLLPDRGCLLFKNGEASDTIWYRKLAQRVLLEDTCRFPHNLGSRIFFPCIEDNVQLTDSISKGDQQIKVINAQELPQRGKLKICSLFSSTWIEFVREGDILFLQTPLPASFSMRASLKMPNIYLKTHLFPGADYFDVSDPLWIPQSGEIFLQKAQMHKMYKQKNRGEEKIVFKYQPDILWLDLPLEKNYEIGTVIFSPELFIKGAAHLKMDSIENTTEMFTKWLMERIKFR